MKSEVKTVRAPLKITSDAAKIPARLKSPRTLIKRGPRAVMKPLEKLMKLVGITNRRSVRESGCDERVGANRFLCFGNNTRIKISESKGASKILSPANRTSFAKN